MNEHYLVLADTPTYKKGEKLKKLIVNNLVYFGIDRKNRFHTRAFFDSKPDLFELVK
jgi:hypothetical protein